MPGIVKFERCAPDDPSRCQSDLKSGGQCPYKAVGNFNTETQSWEGPRFCVRHGANKVIQAEEAKSVRLYLAAKWQTQIAQFAEHPKVKTLREEIGIMRMSLNTQLDKCKDEEDLLMRSGKITEMVREIGKLVSSAERLEKSMAQHLDKNQATAWVQELSEIISRYIDDPAILEMVAEDMIESIDKYLPEN